METELKGRGEENDKVKKKNEVGRIEGKEVKRKESREKDGKERRRESEKEGNKG